MISDLALVWLGSVAVLASIGVLVPMDRLTNIIIPWVAAIWWGATGLSAGEVAISDTDPVVTADFQPVLWLGVVMAFVCVMLGLYEIVAGTAKTIGDAGEPDSFDL